MKTESERAQQPKRCRGFLSEAFSRRSRESSIKISPEASSLGECSADRQIMWPGGVAPCGLAWRGVM